MMRGEGPAEVFAVIDVVAPDGSRTTVRPAYRVVQGQIPQGEVTPIPGGATLELFGIDPANQSIQLQLGGVDLGQINPGELKGRIFVEISQEPGIRLVWTGIIIALLGGGLAALRRWREAQATAASLPLPPVFELPRARPTLQPGVAQMNVAESEAR